MDAHSSASRSLGNFVPDGDGPGSDQKSMACTVTGTHTVSCRPVLAHISNTQSTGIALTLGGYILGHSHGGRAFLPGAHGVMANIVLLPILLQLALGVYLKLHIHEETIRPWAVKAHGIVGKAYPIIGWTQMLFGAIAFRGYCRGGNLGQCLAHYIMVRAPLCSNGMCLQLVI